MTYALASGVRAWRATTEHYASFETVFLVHPIGHHEIHHYSHADAEQCARENRDYGYNVRTSMRTETRELPRYVPITETADSTQYPETADMTTLARRALSESETLSRTLSPVSKAT